MCFKIFIAVGSQAPGAFDDHGYEIYSLCLNNRPGLSRSGPRPPRSAQAHTQGPTRRGGAGFFALQKRTCLRGAWGCQKCHCTVDTSQGMPWPQQASDWRVALPRMLACRNCSCQPASSNFMDKVIKHVVWSSGQRPRPDAPPERGGVECRQSRGIVTRFQRFHAEARIQVQGGRQGSAKGNKVSGGGVLGS